MAFYVIEKQDQLDKLTCFGDCFIDFISQNNNFHPKISPLSLIYLRPLNDHKGYIFCLNHSESFSLDKEYTINWINNNTQKLFTPDKKKALYYFNNFDKLYDINFIESIPLDKLQTNNCIDFYYKKHYALPNVNCLIPLSKHYEEKENLFGLAKPIISQFRENNNTYKFNNNQTTQVFFEIENNGIKIDKDCFIDCYGGDLKHPEFNILKGKIYSHYNLYTTTSRPSNSYNHINFVALNKNNGERLCYRPSNDMFIEFDIQGYHPRILGEMINFSFLNTRNTYETLATILDVSYDEAKELTFKQIYGGVWNEYKNKPFFKDIIRITDDIWDTYQFSKYYETKNRIFAIDKDMTQSKLLNYIIQSKETSINVEILTEIINYLKDKQTKLVLYVYDSILIDYAHSDGNQVLSDIKNMIHYPVNIKTGKNYHNLQKI